MRGLYRITVLFSLQLVVGATARATAEPPAATVPIADAGRLVTGQPPDQLVRMQGTVTWCWKPFARRPQRHFIIDDGTGGIWVNGNGARQRGLWTATDFPSVAVGDLVEVTGRLTRGGYDANLLPTAVTVVSSGPLPAAPLAVADDFFRGQLQGRRATVTGIVQDGRKRENQNWLLSLVLAGRRFLAEVPTAFIGPDVSQLIDAEVRLSGVVMSTFNTRGQFIRPRLLVSRSTEFTVELAAPADPFTAPQIELAELDHHTSQPVSGHRICTVGTVTSVQPGGRLTVQQGLVGVWVQAREPVDVRPGDQIEIAGFIDRSRDFAQLTGATIRTVGQGTVPAAIEVSPQELTATIVGAFRNGQMAQPTDYDGCLVRSSGTISDIQRSATSTLLTLVAGGSSLTVQVDRRIMAVPPGIDVGATVEATGILQVSLAAPFDRMAGPEERPYAEPIQRLTLLPRSAADLTVLKPAPWWNDRRLAVAASGLAMVLLAAVGWVVALRRQVAVQAARVAGEVRRRHDAEIEFQAALRERNRLAVNLHDTLLQSLGGAGFQLDTCRRAVARADLADTAAHLDVARRMLRHAAGELRSSVWALRTMPQAGRSFAESLDAIVEQLAAGQEADLRLSVSGTPFDPPDFIAGNLLLVAQEAIRNALHHGRPTTVAIDVNFTSTPQQIEVVVQDDGHGFSPTTAAGPSQGHFGIQGMRERLTSLGGSLTIDSQSGHGTRVQAAVAITALADDEDAA